MPLGCPTAPSRARSCRSIGGVANVVALGVPLRRAVAMATEIPARLIGCHDRGRLAAGARADLVALDPATLSVRAVWFGGRAVGR